MARDAQLCDLPHPHHRADGARLAGPGAARAGQAPRRAGFRRRRTAAVGARAPLRRGAVARARQADRGIAGVGGASPMPAGSASRRHRSLRTSCRQAVLAATAPGRHARVGNVRHVPRNVDRFPRFRCLACPSGAGRIAAARRRWCWSCMPAPASSSGPTSTASSAATPARSRRGWEPASPGQRSVPSGPGCGRPSRSSSRCSARAT